jgi:hypothetical protein
MRCFGRDFSLSCVYYQCWFSYLTYLKISRILVNIQSILIDLIYFLFLISSIIPVFKMSIKYMKVFIRFALSYCIKNTTWSRIFVKDDAGENVRTWSKINLPINNEQTYRYVYQEILHLFSKLSLHSSLQFCTVLILYNHNQI